MLAERWLIQLRTLVVGNSERSYEIGGQCVRMTAEQAAKCRIIFTGDRKGATDFLLANGAAGMPVIGAMRFT